MKKLAMILLMTMVLTIQVFAKVNSEIHIVLEEPAVSTAKSGDRLDYNLVVTLPKDYKDKYSSVSVTLLMDENLKVEKTNLSGASVQAGKIDIKVTNDKNTKQNYITFNMNDFDSIKENRIVLHINTVVKKNIKKNQGLKNSFALSYLGKDGKSNTSQKNLQSSTKAEEGKLMVEDIFSNTKVIKGVTEGKAKVIITIDGKEIAKGQADEKGQFALPIKMIQAKTKVSIDATLGDKMMHEFKIVRPESEIYRTDDLETTLDEVVGLESMEELQDYISYGKSLNVSKSSKEDAARLMAAIAQGQYILVKSDVKSSEISDAVMLIKEGIAPIRVPYMSGYEKKKFGPEDSMTRAQVASVFRRLLTGDKVRGDFSSFKDVKGDQWYAGDIATMENYNLISGYEDNTFQPNKGITRAEFASIVQRYLKLPNEETSLTFTDIKSTHWARKDIETLVKHGLMSGRSDREFAPDEKITRSEAAVVIANMMDRKPKVEFLKKYGKNPFTDVKDNHWAKYYIMEVTGN